MPQVVPVIDRLSRAARLLPPSQLDEFWTQVMLEMHASEARFGRAVIQAFEKAAQTADWEGALDYIKSGNYDSAVSSVLGVEAHPAAFSALRTTIASVVIDTTERLILGKLPAVFNITGPIPHFEVFDKLNPRVVQEVRQHAFESISNLSATTRAGLKRTLVGALESGAHPYQAAMAMRNSLGLTERDAIAVQNYRNALEKRSLKALQYATRNGRFDQLVREKRQSAEQIDRMVADMQRRMIKQRAEMVSITEASRAFNASQDQTWKFAIESGLATQKTLIRRWMVSPMESKKPVCQVCMGIASANAKGVEYNQPFIAPAGLLLLPPAHPRCRCVVAVRIEFDRG